MRIASKIALVAAFCAVVGPARAESVSALVEEQARATLGATAAQAEMRVTLREGTPEEAALLTNFRINPNTGQFAAHAILEDGSAAVVQGLAVLTLEVPVPVRSLAPGDIVQSGDIRMERVHAGRISAWSVTDPADLVGQEVRHMLLAGRPVMKQAVSPPVVIRRGQMVSLRFRDAELSISTPARALADAPVGGDVKVVNLASNLVIQGIAIQDGTVEVSR
jgi:flagellar basal body P-ring formation protein FlgA